MNGLRDYCDKLVECTTLNGVGSIFRRAVAKEGYAASACNAFLPTANGLQSRSLFRNWPKEWARLSDEGNFGRHSPVLPYARRSVTPFTWIEANEATTMTSAEKKVWNTALEWGWSNGFVVPIHGPNGYFCYVGMASRERDLNLCGERRAYLYLMAMLAHERCYTLSEISESDNGALGLTERELECLRWVAAGKTDWEIGMILTISSSTVRFHVERARKKLKALTRPQAVATLAARGLL
jgi:LuxR family quorum sensing-dependent transcriptional regulator